MTKVDLILEQSEKSFMTEANRTERLTGKAEKYLAVIGLLVTVGLVNIKGPFTFGGTFSEVCSTWLNSATLIAFAMGFALTVFTMRNRHYVSHPHGSTLIDELKDEKIKLYEAQIRVAMMYLEARRVNAEINTERASVLKASGVLLVLGFVFAIASRIVSGS